MSNQASSSSTQAAAPAAPTQARIWTVEEEFLLRDLKAHGQRRSWDSISRQMMIPKAELQAKWQIIKYSQLLPWTWQEDVSLQYLRGEGYTLYEIAAEFPWRTTKELRDRLAHLGRVAWPGMERCFARSMRMRYEH